MAMTIYKYWLKLEDEQEIMLPLGAQFLAVQLQDGTPCLWAKVSTEAIQVATTILTRGTGHPVPADAEYLGTYQIVEKGLVFHVFKA